MRGKDDRPCAYDHTDRITPAYAGKSGWFQRRLQHGGGSPPRMRGKDLVKFCLCPRFGITPAYAGKRLPLQRNGRRYRDHPRVCGEKLKFIAAAFSMWGSPPRMRGKGSNLYVTSASSGITPAYAGKRLKRSHRIGHFSCILCLFHSVLHRASASGGSRAGPCAPPCLPAQNAVPV